MTAHLIDRAMAGSVPLTPLSSDTLQVWLAAQPPNTAAWVGEAGFTGPPGTACLVPGSEGAIAPVLA